MIVRCGALHDGSGKAPLANVDITLEGGHIAAITHTSSSESHVKNSVLREAACVVPGLVNAHVHLEMSGEPDTMSLFARTTQQQRLLAAVTNARKSLRSGVTSVRDLGCTKDSAMLLRDAIEGGNIEGPTVRAAGEALCMTGGHGWFVGRAVDGPWDARKAVREQRMRGADCIKLIATGGVLTKGAVPALAQLTEEEMHAAVTEARGHGMKVAAHAIGAQGIKNALRAGVSSIEHGHMLDDEALELFAKSEAYLVPTLSAATCILEYSSEGALPEYIVAKTRHLIEHMRPAISKAFKAGVKIAGGSDAGTPYNYHDAYWYEVELMHTQLGMTARQALRAATSTAAELVGSGSGILRVGEAADLVLLKRDIDQDLRTLREPLAVIRSGCTV